MLLFFLTLFTYSQVKITKPYLRIPIVDLDKESFRQVVVDREDGQYLGHTTTVLLEDGRTILTVYPKGHGRGAIIYKKSTDGGLTWSDRIPVPESWETSMEVPTIYRVIDANGEKRLIVFSGLYPARMAHSEDDGNTWSDPKPLPNELTGDRHVLKYTPDGRLLVVFRDISPLSTRPDLQKIAKERNEVNMSAIAAETGQGSPTEGDWVGWVGTWKDLVKGKKGQYRIRFKDNMHRWDCCYPGVELLPDETFVVTTYGHWEKYKQPYILCVRFKMKELDDSLQKNKL